MSEAGNGQFEHCAGCPSPAGCSAAMYCVTESRFHLANREIAAPACGTCGQSAATSWACTRSPLPAECAAQSDLWGQWFMVQMYARDEKRRLETGQQPAAADLDGEDDDAPCYHDHDEECYDHQGFFTCSHSHCWNCGGCQCPGYCDDYVTYNLRPAETGGTPGHPAEGEVPGGK